MSENYRLATRNTSLVKERNLDVIKRSNFKGLGGADRAQLSGPRWVLVPALV